MPEKPKEEKAGDLKAKSLDSEAEKIKGGAQPSGAPRTIEPVNTGPRRAEPIAE